MLNVISFLLILFTLQVLAMPSLQLQLILIKIMKDKSRTEGLSQEMVTPLWYPCPHYPFQGWSRLMHL